MLIIRRIFGIGFPDEEEDDDIKLWRECNDGVYWAHKSRRLEKGQFGTIGI